MLLTIYVFNGILLIVVVLWMLVGPIAGGAHAWAPFYQTTTNYSYEFLSLKYYTILHFYCKSYSHM